MENNTSEGKAINRKDIKARAKELINGNLWNLWKPLLVILGVEFAIAICLSIICVIFGIGEKSALYSLLQLLFSLATMPLTIGEMVYYLNFVRGKEYSLDNLFEPYKKNWKSIIAISLVAGLLVALGCVLLVIPGIIIAFMYAMIQYLMADGSTGIKETLAKSRIMMNGHKFEFLIFSLSFLGWALACILIIPAIFVIPYMSVSSALYYEELKKFNK